MSEVADTVVRVQLLATERPDLIPLLRRVLDAGGEGWFAEEDQEGLEELVRRGLLRREYPTHGFGERPAGHGREA